MCPTPDKERFASKQKAKEHIKVRKHKWTDAVKAMIYRCPGLGCDWWHITTHRASLADRAAIKKRFG